MNSLKLVLVVLSVAVVLETAIIAFPLVTSPSGSRSGLSYVAGPPQRLVYAYDLFNQPIINDTNQQLSPAYAGSWTLTIVNSLTASGVPQRSEAQIALAPTYGLENLSIPTLIVQMRGDGLLRIEYFAQDWNRTFGMVLFNSTSPSWTGKNITLRFVDFGPASAVDPQIAPRPNGNLSVFIGASEVVADFPIAWASLTHAFIYGLQGSTFTGGSVDLSLESLEKK